MMQLRRLILIVSATAVLTACGGDGDQGLGTDNPDTGGGTETDTGGGTETDGGGTETDTGGGTETDGGGSTGFNEAEYFFQCESDSDCGDEICVSNVCVSPPRAAALLAEEFEEPDPDDPDNTIGFVEERPGEAIELGCYSDGSLFEPQEGPATTTVSGIVDRFGSGPSTSGLCVSAHYEDALLPWQINNECSLLRDEDEELFVACFQLDACRCEAAYGDDLDDTLQTMIDGANEAAELAELDLTVDSLDTCFSFIGYCDAIEDGDMRSACEARVAANTFGARSTVVFGHTESTLNPDNEQFGQFTISDFPTNVRFAFKVSGRERNWRDTWEYGLFSRADLDRNGESNIDSNVVSAGTWQTIPPAVGFAGGIDDANGAVAGALRDCGRPGEREPWNIVRGTAGFAFVEGDTRQAYFNGNPNNQLPDTSRTDTNLLGLFGVINLPTGPNRVGAMICTANCTPGDPDNTGDPEYTLAGARNVFQTPKSVIIATFEGPRFAP